MVAVDNKGVPQRKDTSQRPSQQSQSQRSKLDKRLSLLESQAVSLAERAEYAEKEAALRKRIREMQNRIRATQPPGWLDGFSLPSLGGLWGKIPTPLKALLVLSAIITVLLFIGKSLSGSG